jgi:hypothetical protein
MYFSGFLVKGTLPYLTRHSGRGQVSATLDPRHFSQVSEMAQGALYDVPMPIALDVLSNPTTLFLFA